MRLAIFLFFFLISQSATAADAKDQLTFDDREVRVAYAVLFEYFMGQKSDADNYKPESDGALFLGYCSAETEELDISVELFPRLNIETGKILLRNLTKLAFMESQLRRANIDISAVDSLFRDIYFEFDIQSQYGMYTLDGIDADEDSIFKYAMVFLNASIAKSTGERPRFHVEDSCGGGVELTFDLDPPGGRVWWTTEFRVTACATIEPNCDPWREITGNKNMEVSGDRMFLVRWPDGREGHSKRSFDRDTYIVLRPD